MKCVQKSMFPAFETIKAENGILQHLPFHQARFDKTRKEVFGISDKIELSSLLSPPQGFTCRVRLEYDKEILKIEYIPYQPREIRSFCLIEAKIDYAYKWCDRRMINDLLKEGCDDIIITQNGFLQDTSIANIALYIDGKWLTPKKPLLKGTTRHRLLESGFLSEENLVMDDIRKMEKFAIMNALIGFKIVENIQIVGDKI